MYKRQGIIGPIPKSEFEPETIRRKIAANPLLAGIDPAKVCLLYTSDAADERSRVDLGGRRIIKKKHVTASCAVRIYYA